MKKVHVLFLIVSVLFFALACQNEPEPEPEKVPEIPAVLQNTEWTHTSGDKISFTKDSVTITPSGGSAQTFKLKDINHVNTSGNDITDLFFNADNRTVDQVRYMNGSIEMVNFSIINASNRAHGWSEGNNNNNNTGTGTYGDFAYSYTSSSVTITGYTGNGGDVIIPSVIDGKPVTAIADITHYNNNGVFQSKNLTSITIPSGVTSIGSKAFGSNQLTSVTIPNSVTSIGRYAFNFNQLTSVNIPYSITSIDEGVFAMNELTSITIPNSVTSIGEDAFAINQLTSVTIPNSVTSIGERAFSGNKIPSITIPDSVTSMGVAIFDYIYITSITVGANCPYQFPPPFQIVYEQNNKAAGTYTRPHLTIPGGFIEESENWTKIN